MNVHKIIQATSQIPKKLKERLGIEEAQKAERCRAVVEEIHEWSKTHLDDVEKRDVEFELQHSEWGVALNLLLDKLAMKDVVLPENIYNRLCEYNRLTGDEENNVRYFTDKHE